MNLHKHYLTLNELEIAAVDAAFMAAYHEIKDRLCGKFGMDDRAERVVEAPARFVVEGRNDIE